MHNSKAVVRAQHRKKQIAVDYFGGKCCICGYDKCLAALEFHHIFNKKEAPSYIIIRWAWNKVKEELDKCILVCSNCHREIHYNNVDTSLQKYVKPWQDFKCFQCKQLFSTKNEEQIYCSVACAQFSNRKVYRPSKEELQNLINTNIPFTKLGLMFGVSDNAVRKWAKKYEIEYKTNKK